MKLLSLAFVILFCSCSSKSTSWEELHRQGEEYHIQNRARGMQREREQTIDNVRIEREAEKRSWER